MSEAIGNPVGRARINPPSPTAATAASAARSGTSAPSAATGGLLDAAHEAYSFVCLSCGYGWEQEYEIEHRADRQGHITCHYRANGVQVPSPLLKPACPGCGAGTVRIMGAGRVAAADRFWGRVPGAPGPGPQTALHTRHGMGEAAEAAAEAGEPRSPHRTRRRLRFQIRLRRRGGTPEA